MIDANGLLQTLGETELGDVIAQPTRSIDPSRWRADKKTGESTRFICTNSILSAVFPPLRWIVPGFVPEGLSVLAGRQKLGKSRMALDFALATAIGGLALGTIPCEAGDVLYIDLENGQARIQRRIVEIYPDPSARPDLARLRWAEDAPAIGPALYEMLDDWVRRVDAPRLIIIDVLARVKPAAGRGGNAYEEDYKIYAPMQRWAQKAGVALLVLHHTRKGGADDPLEALAGSNGLSAVADTTLVLDRSAEGATLYVRGRDVEEKDSALRSIGGCWHLEGEASEVRRSSERSRILAALKDAEEDLSPKDIAEETGMKGDNVRQLLRAMVKAGEVEKVGRGHYALPGIVMAA